VKQVLIKDGGIVVADVPAPGCSPRNVLVALEHSCISVGTEISGVRMSGLPLYRRALRQPQYVARVLQMVRDQGLVRTARRVSGILSSGQPTGYSAAGVVIAVGDLVEEFGIGDRVACAGAGIANHAEVIDVPVNLAVRVPANLDSRIASTVTLGAIALQGVRRCAPTLGETIVVVGLGVLGQLTVQMLRANGCRVIGTDVEVARIAKAVENGLEVGLNAADGDYVPQVVRLTDGFGADAAIVTAASTSDEIMSQAMRCCRRKARVVMVGDVGLNLQRADMYAKELDLLISTSYGPGRYDAVYEEGGNDYPLPYVRWTENRNMEAYLDMLAGGRVRLDNLLGDTYEIDRAGEAYARLKEGGSTNVLTLLSYPGHPERRSRTVSLRQSKTAASSKHVRVAVVGAGNFAHGTHLPNLIKLRDQFQIRSVMSRTGSNARAAAIQFGAHYATTQFEEVLNDPEVDLVLIATRHDLHAPMALQALSAGKHVLVEKPLALNQTELDEITSFFASRGESAPMLMTGYNRRFSPAIVAACRAFEGRSSPLIVNYRMNAGYIPLDHWVHGPEGGGRNIGEACHVYDLFNCLTGARPERVQASAISRASRHWARNDNFAATIRYSDGSVCTLTYTALGSKAYAKERMELFCDGKVIVLDDYRSLTVIGGGKGWSARTIEKGQLEELQALAQGLRSGIWPIALEQQLSATRVSFEVEEQLTRA
jgi:predicted dehydrogenase/threonine dehydrogenase-like Zn-dependent dehydrogenase